MVCAEGDVVQVGAVIARYDVGGEASAEPAPPAPEAKASAEIAETPEPEVVAAAMAPLDAAPSRKGPSGRFYSPLVRSIAQQEGIGMAELEQVPGTGSEGRVTKKDILAYLSTRTQGGEAAPVSVNAPVPTPAPAAQAGTGTPLWRRAWTARTTLSRWTACGK